MKIAILVYLFPPVWLGGTEVATYNIARELAQRHEVHVLTTSDKGQTKESRQDGFTVHRVAQRSIFLFDMLTFSIGCLLKLRQINPGIVQAQGIIPPGVPAFLSKKLLGRPYVVCGQGSDVYLRSRVNDLVSKQVLKEARAVISLTNDMRNAAQSISQRDVSVIPNGVSLSSFDNLSPQPLRKILNISDEERVILFVGTLRPVKGVKYLIEAMSIINHVDDRVRLLLVGGGEERGNLEILAKRLAVADKVNFMGKVPHQKVPEFMSASDVFVLPSLSEGFPLTILEAMASGLPVVASRVGGLPEIIQEGKNGFLTEPGNPKDIAEKVLGVLGNSQLRRRMSSHNREKAKEYSWERVVKMIEQVYSTVLT